MLLILRPSGHVGTCSSKCQGQPLVKCSAKAESMAWGFKQMWLTAIEFRPTITHLNTNSKDCKCNNTIDKNKWARCNMWQTHENGSFWSWKWPAYHLDVHLGMCMIYEPWSHIQLYIHMYMIYCYVYLSKNHYLSSLEYPSTPIIWLLPTPH